MRKKIVAGNWKMNNSLNKGIELALEINELARELKDCKTTIILAPPFIHLSDVAQLVDRDLVQVAAQNVADQAKGAYTGEVSAAMIRSTGAEYCIVGHSERRKYYAESNSILARKLDLLLENNLTPIFCIGEELDQRQAAEHFAVVESQLNEGAFHLDAASFSRLVIAYEPVWAIGTGLTASPEQAQEMHAHIRKLISNKYGQSVADSISILYGGSCKASNAAELFSQRDVDGGLIGGASLDAKEFIAIVTSFR